MKTNTTTTNQQHIDNNTIHDNIILTLNDLTEQQILAINKFHPNSLIQKIDTLPTSELNLTYSDIDYITNQILNALIDIYLNTDYNIYLIVPDNPVIAYCLSQLIYENSTPRLKDKIIPIYITNDNYIIEL